MEARQAVATPGGLRWAEGRDMARVTAPVDISIRFSYFVCLLIQVGMILNLLLANPKKDLKVVQELSFITDAEAMTACSC